MRPSVSPKINRYHHLPNSTLSGHRPVRSVACQGGGGESFSGREKMEIIDNPSFGAHALVMGQGELATPEVQPLPCRLNGHNTVE